MGKKRGNRKEDSGGARVERKRIKQEGYREVGGGNPRKSLDRQPALHCGFPKPAGDSRGSPQLSMDIISLAAPGLLPKGSTNPYVMH